MELIGQKKKNRPIEFWRFVFTVFVVLFHMQVSYDREPNFLVTGTYAVEFFFCLSGYLLAASFVGKYQNEKPVLPQIGKFVLSRLKKFVPICWLFIILSGAYHVYLYNMVGYTAKQLLEYVKNLWPEFLLLNSVVPCADPANGPTWYISSLLIVSIVYYILFIICKKVKCPWGVLPALISLLVYLLSYWGDNWFISPNLLRGFCCMGFGMCLSGLAPEIQEPARKRSNWFWQIVQLVCLAALGWLFCIRSEDSYTDAILIPFFLLLLFTVFVVDTPLNRVLDNPVSEVLGEVSFVMYLSHILLLTRILWQPSFNLYGNIIIVYAKVVLIVFSFSLVVQYLPKTILFYKKKFASQHEQPNRLVYPDVLCAAATIGVIILYICGGMVWTLAPDMWQFNWLVIAETIVRCAIPIFLMLSGMLLLSPEKTITLSDIFQKYISRLLIAYVGWSAIYAVFAALFNETLFTEGLHGLWTLFFDGPYHLWVIPMLIGIYLTTPFFRGITEKRNSTLLHYSFAVLILFNVLYSSFCMTLPALGNILERVNPSWFGIYATYFFAGYYFSRIKVSQTGKYIWLCILALSAVWFIRSVCSSSASHGTLDDSKWNPNQIPMVIYTISVFMTARNFGDTVARFPKVYQLVQRLSELSFMIYLCHDMFAKVLTNLGFTALTWHPGLSVPVLTIVVLISSIVLSEILLKLSKEIKSKRNGSAVL